MKKDIIAMLLAGGQGSRLGVLTSDVAKPAVSFGGKYKIIDFPLSNCINSGIDTVGVLTQYQPLVLNSHIGIGIPWDLDRNNGGVTVLPPYEKSENSKWYSGTADAVFQNINYIESYDPTYVLILSGDHIYKMDYRAMLDYHIEKQADVTIATIPVPIEEAKRFGIAITDDELRITDFEEKPAEPRGNLASMGIYIFTWSILKKAMLELSDVNDCDFGKHIIPYCHENKKRLFAYRFEGYWKDVGTLHSYWQANMELIDIVPEFNLYEEFWKIYTKQSRMDPEYIAAGARVEKALIGAGSKIYGEVRGSVLGAGVKVEEGATVTDSIIMRNVTIKKGAVIDRAIIAENTVVGENTVIGEGEEAQSKLNPGIYADGLVTIGDNSVIPADVRIGKNVAIHGHTSAEDYPGGALESGGYIIKVGE